MSDLNRILRLAGLPLTESVADDPAMNAEIERRLAKHAPEEQTRILDCLEALKNAGATGLHVRDWFRAVTGLHPGIQASTLATTAKEFDCCVKRIADKTYGWVEAHAPEGNLDGIDPMMKMAVDGQVQMTYEVLDMMKQSGQFNTLAIAQRLNREKGIPLPMAQQFVDHVVNQFLGGGNGSLKQVDRNRYRWEDEVKQGSMDLLRGIANGTHNP